VHDEKVDGFVHNVIDLTENLQDQDKTVLSSMKKFLVEHQKFLKEDGVENTNSDGTYGELPANPSVKDLNAYINASSKSVATQAFKAFAPGLIVPENLKLYLSESNPNSLKINVNIKVKRGESLQKVFALVGDKVNKVSGIDEKALKENIKELHKSFPEIDIQIDSTLTRKSKNGKLAVEARVHGYQIFLGDIQGKKPAKKSDYEIHANVKDLNRFVRQAVEKQFGKEQLVFSNSWTIDYLINTYKIAIKGFIKLDDFKGLNIYWKDSNTIDISAKWRFKIEWPWLGTRYAYATTKIFLNRTMMKEDNSVKVTPEIQLQLGSGWAPQVPNVRWLPTSIVNRFFSRAAKWVIGTGISQTFNYFEKEINKMV
ncbi:hypothetical protein MJH12_06075, partial [bacterium]|nr:hypothetical protein [bacterium]